MKFQLQLTLLLSMLFLVFSCKKSTPKNKTDNTKKPSIIKQSIETFIDTIPSKKTLPKHIKYMYIKAESGLNYRDSPNGKVLGKFSWRDKIEYLFDTEHTQKIIDNYREIEGYWAAIKHKNDTVFVFNNYDYISSIKPRYSRLKLYYAEAYFKDTLKPSNELDIRQAFVNVSESFYMPEGFIDKKDLRKDTIMFNKKQRTAFFKRMNYSNKDTIYIYDTALGLVKKKPVNNYPIMACVNIYSQTRDEYKKENYDQWVYQTGFNLGKESYGGFAVIGKENPFIEKGLEPVFFEEMSQEIINDNIKNNLIPKSWKNDTLHKPHISKYKNFHSFVKINNSSNSPWSDLIIKNTETKESYEIYQIEGESAGKALLNLKEKKLPYDQTYNYQFIGKLFKNKPPVTFGYIWESFGCPEIYFLDNKELPVAILCDNRH